MDSLDKNIIVANIREKVFAWTPPKTASRKAEEILKKLDFKVYTSSGKYLIPGFKKTFHNHSTNVFYGHENYSLLTTLRNPYTLMVSKYKNYWDFKNGVSPEDFSKFLEMWLYSDNRKYGYLQCYNYSIRYPNYIIRQESMFEDYSRIPFVRSSRYYKSGELFNDCGQKINESPSIEIDWKSLYTPNSADMVFYNFAHVFELGDYSRTSWK